MESLEKVYHMGYFISTDELHSILGHKSVKIIDLRDEEKYSSNHIPGSINANSDFFYARNTDGFISLPNPNFLENYLQNLGINASDKIVFVDDVFNLNCSLAAWMMLYFNHPNVMLLDGALTKWIIENKPMTTEISTYEKGTIKLSEPNENILITRDELLLSIQNSEYVIVDNRSEYAVTGDSMGGTIPGAIHFWWMEAFEERPDYFVLKSKDEIRALLEQKGIHENDNIVLYCETAPESALVFLILKELGYKNLKLYLGGYEEWRLYCSFI